MSPATATNTPADAVDDGVKGTAGAFQEDAKAQQVAANPNADHWSLLDNATSSATAII